MSKQIKEMIIRDYKARLVGVNDAAIVSLRGVSGINTTRLRSVLRGKQIRLTTIRNHLAKQAFKGTGLSGLEPLLQGSSVVVYGGQSVVEVARELIAAIAELPTVELKGAVLDGQLFSGKAGVTELSKFPTRTEALGQAVALLLGPAKKVVAQVKGPGSNIAGIIKSIEEKLEKGETIARKAG
jgi:large subunit ribosomal protein L10